MLRRRLTGRTPMIAEGKDDLLQHTVQTRLTDTQRTVKTLCSRSSAVLRQQPMRNRFRFPLRGSTFRPT